MPQMAFELMVVVLLATVVVVTAVAIFVAYKLIKLWRHVKALEDNISVAFKNWKKMEERLNDRKERKV